ncbi:Transient receptor potential cation channel trpm [Schistosoma japonicum]|nr:Transient receptor potential cation channel trpm [Schistosoma japonicum]KAH8876252.1 Transient receptor potential cation channel trpm [Schistosoma japonicum]
MGFGLVQAARSTKAWIVTSGLSLGIVRVVGNALQDQNFYFDKWKPSDSLLCLGIAPWGYVLNRETLISENHTTPVRYEVSDFIATGSPVSLNENHTHYIFVDEGRRLRYGGSKSAEFRAKLEKQIALPIELGGFDIPVVLVIVEGGHDVFIDAKNSITEHVPVVICSGTGRAADILTLAFEYRSKNDEFEGFSEMEVMHLRRKLQSVSGTPPKVDAALKMIEFIVRNKNLITTFDMNTSNDLDLAILFSLIKTSSDLEKQLKLAFTWKRSDIAREKIFQQGKQLKQGVLESFMLEALKCDELDFVKVFLHNGVTMKTFLTVDRLRILYNDSIRRDGLIKCLRKHKLLHSPTSVVYNNVSDENTCQYTRKLRLSTIHKLLFIMLGSFENALYVVDNEDMASKTNGLDGVNRATFSSPFQLVYVIFLVHFSYTLLFETYPNKISIHEAFVIGYFVAMLIDMIQQITQSCDGKFSLLFSRWKHSYLHKSDLCLVCLGLLSASLRIGFSITFIYAKYLYVITLVGCYLRVYGLYSHHPRLGPKLVMIQSMLIELQMFIFILVVVLVSYGVSQQVLLYPYRNNFSWTALVDIFYYPYWNLYGELMLEYAFAQKEGCTSDGVLGTECPMFNYLSPLFLAVYLMIAGILLINLLIAIFSNVFEKIEENSIELWKFNIFAMVLEYSNRSVLPVPFSAVTAILKLILHCLRVNMIALKIRSCFRRITSTDHEIATDQSDEIDSLTNSRKDNVSLKNIRKLTLDYTTITHNQDSCIDDEEWPNPKQLENYCKGVLIRKNQLRQGE